jgi:hypothetical protein
MLVHGRIATLDVYAVAMMIVAGALYVRRRPLSAGAALGVGACLKVVALYLLAALILFEAVRIAQERGAVRTMQWWWGQLRPLASSVALSVAVFFALLWVLDLLVPAWDPGTGRVYGGSPFSHFGHMVSFAEQLKTHGGKGGIASSPLHWLVNQKRIDYAKVAVNTVVGGFRTSSVVRIDFRGEMNPFIIFFAVPALVAASIAAVRHRDRVALLAASWSLGTYLVLFVQGELMHHTSYIYYMLIVMPGIYVLGARLFSPRSVPVLATLVWTGLLVFGFVELYPFRTLISL